MVTYSIFSQKVHLNLVLRQESGALVACLEFLTYFCSRRAHQAYRYQKLLNMSFFFLIMALTGKLLCFSGRYHLVMIYLFSLSQLPIGKYFRFAVSENLKDQLGSCFSADPLTSE